MVKKKIDDIDILLNQLQNNDINKDKIYRYIIDYDLSEEAILLFLPKILEYNYVKYLLQYQNITINIIRRLFNLTSDFGKNVYLYKILDEDMILEFWDKLDKNLVSSQLQLSDKIIQKLINENNDKRIYMNLCCIQKLSNKLIMKNIDKFKQYSELASIILRYQHINENTKVLLENE